MNSNNSNEEQKLLNSSSDASVDPDAAASKVDSLAKVSIVNETIGSLNQLDSSETPNVVKKNKFLIVKLSELNESMGSNSSSLNEIKSLPFVRNSKLKEGVESNKVDNSNKNSAISENVLNWNFGEIEASSSNNVNTLNELDVNKQGINNAKLSTSNPPANVNSNNNNNNNNNMIIDDYSFYDDDDVFEDVFLNKFHKDQNYRELEGQDTITSLSNNIYKKQLEKIRQKALTRNNSITQTSSSTSLAIPNNQNFDRLTIKSGSIAAQSQNSPVNSPLQAIRDIFKSSQESLSSKKYSISLNHYIPRKRSNEKLSKSSIDSIFGSQNIGLAASQNQRFALKNRSITVDTTTNTLYNNEKNTFDQLLTRKDSLRASNTAITNKSDHVFEVIKEAISKNDHNFLDKQFIEKVFNTFKMQELKQKRKKDKARRICFIAEITVFISILVLTFYFAKTVISQIQTIQNKSSYELISQFNATTQLPKFVFKTLNTTDKDPEDEDDAFLYSKIKFD